MAITATIRLMAPTITSRSIWWVALATIFIVKPNAATGIREIVAKASQSAAEASLWSAAISNQLLSNGVPIEIWAIDAANRRAYQLPQRFVRRDEQDVIEPVPDRG